MPQAATDAIAADDNQWAAQLADHLLSLNKNDADARHPDIAWHWLFVPLLVQFASLAYRRRRLGWPIGPRIHRMINYI